MELNVFNELKYSLEVQSKINGGQHMFAVKKMVSVLLLLVFFTLSACATRYQSEGAATGGAIGGIAGALLDHRNPWRGGLIGAGLGAIFGATVADISTRASREAVSTGKPVEYRTENGRGLYRAEPVENPDEHTKCKKVRERVWEDDRLVKDQVKEVCEGEKVERRY